MAKFKLIVSDPGTGKSSVSEVEGARAQALMGRSLGETIDGPALGISPSKLLISGGCDKNGVPMRADVHGGVKRYIVLSSGTGFRSTMDGERRRKLVRGRTITDETYQINFTIRSKEVAPEQHQIPRTEVKPAEEPGRGAKETPDKAKAKKAEKRLTKKTK